MSGTSAQFPSSTGLPIAVYPVPERLGMSYPPPSFYFETAVAIHLTVSNDPEITNGLPPLSLHFLSFSLLPSQEKPPRLPAALRYIKRSCVPSPS